MKNLFYNLAANTCESCHHETDLAAWAYLIVVYLFTFLLFIMTSSSMIRWKQEPEKSNWWLSHAWANANVQLVHWWKTWCSTNVALCKRSHEGGSQLVTKTGRVCIWWFGVCARNCKKDTKSHLKGLFNFKPPKNEKQLDLNAWHQFSRQKTVLSSEDILQLTSGEPSRVFAIPVCTWYLHEIHRFYVSLRWD